MQKNTSFMEERLKKIIPTHIVRKAHQETGGNPKQLIQFMYRELAKTEDYSKLTVESVLDYQLSGVEDETRYILDVIASFPNAITLDNLNQIMIQTDLLIHCQELERRHLIHISEINGVCLLTVQNPHLRTQLLSYKQS